MSAVTLSGIPLAQVHRQFEAALPCMQRALHHHFRMVPQDQRTELIADGLAACWHCWHGLVRRGKDPLAVGPAGIATNAARYVRGGRSLGTGTAGRAAMDVFNARRHPKYGVNVVPLDQVERARSTSGTGSWREWSVFDNRLTPADEAAFRIDFECWLRLLTPRKRAMAELLAEGHETGAAARTLGVTPAAVSIARAWLEESWRRFQGQLSAEEAVQRPHRTRERAHTGSAANVSLSAAR